MVFKLSSDPEVGSSYWLHQKEVKFWEIKYTDQHVTEIRCGKVLEIQPDLIEEPDDQQSIKIHKSIAEVVQYIEKHINTKISRGYQFLNDDNGNEPAIKKMVKGNDNQGIPSINVQAPEQNQQQQQKQKQVQNKNLLQIQKDDYSDTSKKQSLSILTDISQMNKKEPSLNGAKVDLSGLGYPSEGPDYVLLAQKWEKDIDPTGWYMSEKLDGLRGFWSGSNLYSRNKNMFKPPQYFTQNWPNCQLDGELWTKRDDFSKAVSICKTLNGSKDEEWKQIKYVVYDIPGLNKPFKQRVKAMQEILSKVDNPYIVVHPQVLCIGFENLEEELGEILQNGGEGVMIRDPNSYYERKRSKTLLKVKVMHDEEAKVIGFEKSQTRPGLMGAIVCKNKDGIEFKVGQGLTDIQRTKPYFIKVGQVFTYKYQNKQPGTGKPRFPVFLRIRDDVDM